LRPWVAVLKEPTPEIYRGGDPRFLRDE